MNFVKCVYIVLICSCLGLSMAYAQEGDGSAENEEESYITNGWSFGMPLYLSPSNESSFGSSFVEAHMGSYSGLFSGWSRFGKIDLSTDLNLTSLHLNEYGMFSLRKYSNISSFLSSYAQVGASYMIREYDDPGRYHYDMGVVPLIGGGFRYRPNAEINPIFLDANFIYYPSIRLSQINNTTEFWRASLSIGYSFDGNNAFTHNNLEVERPYCSVRLPIGSIANMNYFAGEIREPAFGVEWHITPKDSILYSMNYAINLTGIVSEYSHEFCDYDEIWQISYRRYLNNIEPVQFFAEYGTSYGMYDAFYVANLLGVSLYDEVCVVPVVGVGARLRRGKSRYFAELLINYREINREHETLGVDTSFNSFLTTSTLSAGFTF